MTDWRRKAKLFLADINKMKNKPKLLAEVIKIKER